MVFASLPRFQPATAGAWQVNGYRLLFRCIAAARRVRTYSAFA